MERLNVTRLIELTCQDLHAQGEVPLSPGQVRAGNVTLCAGAALVRRALILSRSADVAREFDREQDFICEVGAGIGLDPSFVRAIVVTNDNLNAGQRLVGTSEYLSRLTQCS